MAKRFKVNNETIDVSIKSKIEGEKMTYVAGFIKNIFSGFTKNNESFVGFTLYDDESEIDCKIWDIDIKTLQYEYNVTNNSFVLIRGNVTMYDDKKSFIVTKDMEKPKKNINISVLTGRKILNENDFIKSGPRSEEEYVEKCKSLNDLILKHTNFDKKMLSDFLFISDFLRRPLTDLGFDYLYGVTEFFLERILRVAVLADNDFFESIGIDSILLRIVDILYSDEKNLNNPINRGLNQNRYSEALIDTVKDENLKLKMKIILNEAKNGEDTLIPEAYYLNIIFETQKKIELLQKGRREAKKENANDFYETTLEKEFYLI